MTQIRKIRLVANDAPCDGDGGVTYRLPRPTPGATLDQIADRFTQKVEVRAGEPLHIVAVANSGVAIAAMALAKFSATHPDSETWLSVVNPRTVNENWIQDRTSRTGDRARTIVVDNSIKTGRTMELVLQFMRTQGIFVDAVLKLVGYPMGAESTGVTLVESMFDVTVLSLFDHSEVRAVTDAGKLLRLSH